MEPPPQYRGVPQMSIHGESLAYTFDDPSANTVRRIQYFEMFGNRGLWADGWKAVTRHFAGTDYDDREWEIYHLDEDFSEARNLASTHPDKLRSLTDQWWQQAGCTTSCRSTTAPSSCSGCPTAGLAAAAQPVRLLPAGVVD